MRILILTLLLTAPLAADEKWTPIFDGKSFDGWTPKFAGHELSENYLDTFRVKDGVLSVHYDKYTKFDNKFGHLFYKDKLSHYKVRFEYRFLGDQCKGGPSWAVRNSGIMLHCQDPKSMKKDQDFPVSIECQLLGGLGKGERPTGNMCSPGTNIVYNTKLYTPHTLNSKSKTFNGDDWVKIEAEVKGGEKINHFINGELVLEYEQPQYDPKDTFGKSLIPKDGKLIISEGYISLQAESHPVEFRNIELLKLKE